MCDFGQLTECLFEGIPKLKAGQKVFVVACRGSSPDDIMIESVLYADEADSPQTALEDFCKAMGLEVANRVCLPVVLPEGLKQEDIKGFRAARQGSGLHIEFTP